MKAHIPQELINELNERYPHRCPDRGDSDRDIWFYAGQRDLVDKLETFCKRQQETILAPKE